MGGCEQLPGWGFKVLMSVFSYKEKKRVSFPFLWFSFDHFFGEACKLLFLQILFK